jgi:hypothetical protein
MKSDLLREATTALSESGHQQSGGKFTRERIVTTLHENQQKGRSRRAMLLPLAAIFVGSTAFAGVNGSLSEVVRSALNAVGFEATAPVAVDEAPEAKHARPAAARGAGPTATPQPAESADPDLVGAELRQETASAPGALSPPEPKAEQAPGARMGGARNVAPDGHELSRRGHRAHFKEGNPNLALEAYDAYLKQQPRGRFAVDARYNRALCLVRLGRHAEAEAALAPFANGEFGDYRKQDAQRLLDALAP